MSYFFLPTDVWIPSSTNSSLNPIASVYLKSTIVSICAVAPVVPLLRGWALHVAQHETLRTPTSIHTAREFRGAIDALMKVKPSTSFLFRGSLPLLASIPIASASALTVHIASMMATSAYDEKEALESAATAVGAIVGGELVIQPLRYLYFQLAGDRTGALNVRTAWRQAPWTGLYRGFGAAIVASSILQLSPHLQRYYGLQPASTAQSSVEAGCGLLAYFCYMSSFRRACTPKGVAPISTIALLQQSPLAIGAGLLSMVAARVMVATLQATFSAQSYLIPF